MVQDGAPSDVAVRECYRALVDIAPDPAIILTDSHVIMANDLARELLGIEDEPIETIHPLEFVHEDFRGASKARIDHLLAADGPLPPAVMRLRRRDGQLVTVQSTATSVALGGGRAVVAILKDLRPARDAEINLASAEYRSMALIQSAPMGMNLYRLTEGDELVLTDVNAASDEILGTDTHALVGLTIEEAFPDLVTTPIPDIYRDVARSGEPWVASQVIHEGGDAIRVFEIHAFQIGVDTMAAMFSDVTERVRLDQELAGYRADLETLLKERTERLDEVRKELDAVTSIAGHTVEMRDPYTAGHQRRVSRLAVEIARELGYEQSFIEEIEGAAHLHDLGKVAVPAEILAKPARLSVAEYALVQQHPRAAYEILTSVKTNWPVAEMVLQHHERMDGSGYPAGLVGEQIHIGARVLAVADVVEAMASHRPYRPACGESAALEEISRNSGTLYDPLVVDGCIRVFAGGFAFGTESEPN